MFELSWPVSGRVDELQLHVNVGTVAGLCIELTFVVLRKQEKHTCSKFVPCSGLIMQNKQHSHILFVFTTK